MSYERQIATVKRIIAAKGAKVTWRKPAATANVNQPWKAAAAQPRDYPVSIVFKSAGSGLFTSLIRLLKDTDVPTGAPTALMASVPFTPEITDVVIFNGEVMNIAAIDPVAPDGTPILYKVRFA